MDFQSVGADFFDGLEVRRTIESKIDKKLAGSELNRLTPFRTQKHHSKPFPCRLNRVTQTAKRIDGPDRTRLGVFPSCTSHDAKLVGCLLDVSDGRNTPAC